MHLEQKFKPCRAYQVKTPTTAATEAGANDVWVIPEDQTAGYVNCAPEASGVRA